MLTYSKVIELREKLASGKMSLESAQAQYWKDFKEVQKSWDTKDWKERRAKIIKDKSLASCYKRKRFNCLFCCSLTYCG